MPKKEKNYDPNQKYIEAFTSTASIIVPQEDLYDEISIDQFIQKKATDWKS